MLSNFSHRRQLLLLLGALRLGLAICPFWLRCLHPVCLLLKTGSCLEEGDRCVAVMSNKLNHTMLPAVQAGNKKRFEKMQRIDRTELAIKTWGGILTSFVLLKLSHLSSSLSYIRWRFVLKCAWRDLPRKQRSFFFLLPNVDFPMIHDTVCLLVTPSGYLWPDSMSQHLANSPERLPWLQELSSMADP